MALVETARQVLAEATAAELSLVEQAELLLATRAERDAFALAREVLQQKLNAANARPAAMPLRVLPNSDERLHAWGNLYPRHVAKAIEADKLGLVDAPFVLDAGAYGEPLTPEFLELLRARADLTAMGGELSATGRYIAWVSTSESNLGWPAKWFDYGLVMRQEGLLDSLWGGQAGRRNFTVRLAESAAFLAEWLVGTTLAVSESHSFIRVDNASMDYGGLAPPELTPERHTAAQALLLEHVGRLAHAAGLPVVVNLAYSVEPSPIYAKYAAWVDGWVRENAVPAAFRKPEHQGLVEAYLDGDRATLDAGKLLFLIPIALPGRPAAAIENELAAAYAMLIRAPGDRLFVGGMGYPAYIEDWPYAWAFWPRDLGPATDRYVRTGTVFTRRFERGVLTVDFVAGTVRVEIADA